MSNETACVTRRTKGDGTIFQNKKGRWIARIREKDSRQKNLAAKRELKRKPKGMSTNSWYFQEILSIICCLLKNMQLNSLTTKVSR